MPPRQYSRKQYIIYVEVLKSSRIYNNVYNNIKDRDLYIKSLTQLSPVLLSLINYFLTYCDVGIYTCTLSVECAPTKIFKTS